MYNPCIAIDVSKGRSHIQGFLNNGVKVTKAKLMKHDKDGFQMILDLVNNIKEKTNQIPIVLFEYTGIYHKSLEQFLKEHNITYHPVPPLQAAKIRQTELHNVKNDKKDCETLSKVYYSNALKKFYNPTLEEHNLRQLHKQYCMLEAHYQKIEVNFYEYLDTLYPNYHSVVSEVDSFASLEFLHEFPHPSMVTSHRKLTIVNKHQKLTGHSQHYSYLFVNYLFDYLETIVSGESLDSHAVFAFKNLIEQAIYYKKQMEEVINRIYLHIKDKSIYKHLVSIPGIAKTLACRIIAELGDIDRFVSHRSIVSYAGLDPRNSQSGDKDGKHLSITKRGNKRLRQVLFIAVRSMIRNFIPNNHIQTFYKKKKAQPNCCNKVALVACMNKLIKIIYQMNLKNEDYSFTSQV